MKWLLPVVLLSILLICCTKKVGTNPELAYNDKALYDSCLAQTHVYYKNDPGKLFPGTGAPHGAFKLRFNAVAANALTDNGKLPSGSVMPDNSMVIKDVYRDNKLDSYAFMYKKSGSWLWGEVTSKGQVTYGIKLDPSICINCHRQPGNRDLVVSFNFY